MIQRSYIADWQTFAPWRTNEQVKQDLVICRAIADIYEHVT
jgi:hypothetical protein